MSRKFIIVFVITTLFTALVVGFSWFYLSQLLEQRNRFPAYQSTSICRIESSA
jgi:hypothetical protein